jgi:hypothetical protein
MGTWGLGNFENDTAADHLSILTARLIEEIDNAVSNPDEIEPDEYWGVAVPCNIELLCVFQERGYVGCVLPKSETIQQWKATYMSVWDAKIDGFNPEPDYKKKRRDILCDTFDRLIGLAQEEGK